MIDSNGTMTSQKNYTGNSSVKNNYAAPSFVPNLGEQNNASGGANVSTGVSSPGITLKDIGNAYYTQLYNSMINSASASRDEQIKAAKDAALRKEVYANTRREVMEKYMPETLRARGLENSGLSADALIGMDANYTNYVMGAKSEQAAAEQDAWKTYQQAAAEIENQKSQNELAMLETQQNNYNSLMSAAARGEYEWSYIESMARSFGLSEEQITAIKGVFDDKAAADEADKAEIESANDTANYNALVNNIYAGEYNDVDYLKKACELYGLSEEDTERAIAEFDFYTNKEVESAIREIYYAADDTAREQLRANIEKEKELGTISQAAYERFIEGYQKYYYDSLIKEFSDVKEGSSLILLGGVMAKMREYKKNKQISDEQYTELKSLIKEILQK